ncbi:MAG: DUF6143 family protein [Bacillota bacterium]
MCWQKLFGFRLPERANYPISLYKSMQGRYFVGYADNLSFGQGTSAWARLYNPIGSGVILHVNVWTISDVMESTFRVQIWFNAKPPGMPSISDLVTPANLALVPQPQPKVRIEFASKVIGEPTGGVKAFVRRGEPETTIVAEEDGKFIFREGQSFMAFLSNPETPTLPAEGRVAFGWWEEPVNCRLFGQSHLRPV